MEGGPNLHLWLYMTQWSYMTIILGIFRCGGGYSVKGNTKRRYYYLRQADHFKVKRSFSAAPHPTFSVQCKKGFWLLWAELLLVAPEQHRSISSDGNWGFWDSDGVHGGNRYCRKTTAARPAIGRMNSLPWQRAVVAIGFCVPNTPQGIDAARKTTRFPPPLQNTTPATESEGTFAIQ